MSEATLETYIRQLLESHRNPQVTVAWQGGEPTLMKLDFFRRSVEMVEQYRRPGQTVQHTFQTNGILLDADWCAFFKEHNFLVGLSVDGPRDLHDMYRRDRDGRGTFDRVMRGWWHLRECGVDFNILCTVNAANENHGREVYRFLRDELEASWIQFVPIVECATAETLQIANRGWSEQYRLLPRGRLRGVGAPRRGKGVRAVIRRDTRGVFRPSPVGRRRAVRALSAVPLRERAEVTRGVTWFLCARQTRSACRSSCRPALRPTRSTVAIASARSRRSRAVSLAPRAC